MKPPAPPLSAKVARLRVARTYAAERVARRALTALQARYDAGGAVSLTMLGFQTMNLWAAQALHRAATARYQETLRRREAMPALDRWSVAVLEAWLRQAQTTQPSIGEGVFEGTKAR